MKKIYGLLALAAILATACKKDDLNGGNAQLQGRWTAIESYFGVGGPTAWQDANTVIDVTFGASGQLKGNAFTDYVTYKLKDSVTLTFKKADGTLQNFYYIIKHDTLEIGPKGPTICTEGCGTRFKKAK